MKSATFRLICCSLVFFVSSLTGCKDRESEQQVVVYTSLDKVFSQPILETIEQVTEKLGVSQRSACKAIGQNRATQRYELKMPEKDRAVHGRTAMFSRSTASLGLVNK